MAGVLSCDCRLLSLRFFARLAAAFALLTGAAGLAQTGPHADFVAEVRTGAVPFTVTFADQSTGSVTNRFWSFGDGATSNSTDTGISHTYTATGTNTVMLIVRGPDGSDTNTQPGYVVVAGCPANLVATPSSLNFGSVAVGQCADREVKIVNTGCITLNGDASPDWPFAVTAGAPFHIAPGETNVITVTFCPPSIDNYGGNLAITSDGGVTAIAFSALAVGPAVFGVSPANYDFGFVATNQTAQTVMVVTNSGESALIGTATVSGAFAVIGNGTFNIPSGGTSNILVGFSPTSLSSFSNDVVFASNGGGATNPVIGSGAASMSVDFVANVRTGQIPFTVTFTDNSSGDITNRFWSFGDGATSNATGTSVAHVYTATGPMTVSLVVQGSVGSFTNIKVAYVVPTNCVPQLFVSPPSLNFGAILVGQSNTMNLAVANIGCTAMTGTVSADWPFEIASGSPFNLAPGATNFVVIRFNAAAAGSYSSGVVIASDGGYATSAVSGVALGPPMLGVSPESYDFGYVITGQTAQATFVVTNIGGQMLSGTATVGGAFAIIGNASFAVAGFGSTNVTVRFTPAFEMPFSSPLVFASNGGGSTNPVAGVGASAPNAVFVADVRTGQVPFTVTFTDKSSGIITNRFWSFGDGATSNASDAVISHTYTAAGTNTVQLIAQSVVGAATNTKSAYIVATNCPPQLFVVTTSLDFGTLVEWQTNDLQLTLINIGCATLTGSASVGGPFELAAGSPFVIAAGATNEITVSFRPMSAGGYSDHVVIFSSGGNATSAVAGVAIPPFDVSPSSYDFGTVATGQTAQKTFVVTNRGEAALTGTTTVNGAFALLGNGSFNLSGHGASNISIRFTPPAAGSFSNNVVFASNGGGATNPVTGIGAALPQAIFLAYSRTGQIPFAVDFSDYSTGDITNRFWSFGDGTTTNTLSTIVPHMYMTAGVFTVRLVVQSLAGADTNTQAEYIAATNCVAQLSASPALLDFGGVAIGATGTLNMTVANIGCVGMTGIASVGGPFTISSGGFFNLASGATNFVTIKFHPQTPGGFTNEVVIVSQGGNTTGLVTGVGLAPALLAVSPASYDFGLVATGQSVQTTFIVTNAGEAMLAGTATVSGAFAVVGDGSFNLEANGSSNITIRFAPLSSGAFSNNVIFASNGGGSVNPVAGIGSAPVRAAFVANVRTGQVPFVVTFTDNSTGVITNRLWTFGDGETSNATATVISHTYTSAGTNTVELFVESPAGPDTNTKQNYIVATNCPPLLFVVTPSLGFGAITVGQTSDMNLAVANIGCAALAGTASVGGPFAIASGSPLNISGATTNQIVVSFRPLVAGGFTNQVVITSDGGNATSIVTGVALTAPQVGVSPSSYDFGSVNVGQTGVTAFVVTNLGESALNGTVVVGSPFAVASGGSFYVPGHGAANVMIAFVPTGAGSANDQVAFFSNGGDALRSVSGVGVSVPVAAFAATIRTGQVPFAVTFDNLSSGSITNYVWSFGDGATSNTTGSAMSHTYANTGAYTVQLVAQGPLGSDTNTQPGYILVTNCPPVLFAAPTTNDFGIVAAGTSNDLALTVVNLGCTTMTGAASVGGPFSIVAGSPFSVAAGATNLLTVRFHPVAAGGYTNDLIITSDGGILTNVVTGVATSDVLNADFAANVRTGQAPFAVTFTDLSTGAITNRVWTFGDGSTSNATGSLVPHSYATAGVFTVELMVEDAFGAHTNSRPDYIVVTNCPPQLYANPASLNFGSVVVGQSNELNLTVANIGCDPLTGAVTVGGPFAIASGSPFNIGPGVTNLVVIRFQPSLGGGFTNHAVIVSGGGTATCTVSGVGLAPAAIGIDPLSYDFGYVATGQSAQAIFAVTNFGDFALAGTATVSGAFSVIGNPAFNLAAHGSSNIVIRFVSAAEDLFTNTANFSSDAGNIGVPLAGYGAVAPQADFVANVRTGMIPLEVTFTDTSSGTVTNRLWDFGDMNSSNMVATAAVHTYSDLGGSTVRLIVQGPLGSSTNTKPNYIVVTNCPPQLSIHPASLNFGELQTGQSTNLDIAAINIGCSTLTGTVSVGGPFSVVSGGSLLIAPGETNIVTVNFQSLEVGVFTNSIHWNYGNLAVTSLVTGAALSPASLGVTPSSHDFGLVVTGQTAQTVFTATNLGDSVLSGTATVSSVFSIIGNASFSLSGHGATNITVAFAPTSGGGFSNDVSFANTGGDVLAPVTGVGATTPQADFFANIRTGQTPFVVTFTDTSAGTVTNRFWSFGDGSTSNVAASNVTHVYTVAGTNTVRLIASGPAGTNTITKPDYIVVTPCDPRLVVVSPSLNFGGIAVGHSNDLNLPVANIGCVALTGSASVGGPFAIVSGSPFSIEPGATNEIAISFRPLLTGGYTNEVVITSDGGIATGLVTGVALTAPLLSVVPANYDFGTVATNAIAQTSFAVTNLGESALTGTAVVSGAFAIVGDGAFVIAGHGATNILVSFAPTAIGAFSNDVVFTSNGGDSTCRVTGAGAQPIVVDFVANVRTGTAPFAVTFTDLSTGVITNRFWSFGDGATSNATGTNVEHTYVSSGDMAVQLIARGPVGAITNTKSDYVHVTGCPPLLAIESMSLTIDFGNVAIGQTNIQYLTTRNFGCIALTGNVSVGGPFCVASGNPFVIAAGGTNILSFSFIPTSEGSFTNEFIIASNGGAVTGLLTGVGFVVGPPPGLHVIPSGLDFGVVGVGYSRQLSLTVTNFGESTLIGNAYISGAYSVTTGGSYTVPPHHVTNVTIRFTPQVDGQMDEQILFTSNAGFLLVPVTGIGVTFPAASFIADVRTGQVPLVVTFTDTSAGIITNRLWSFGDGTTSNATGTNVTHVYTNTGTMTVQLSLQGPAGTDANTQSDYITVTNCPPMLYFNPTTLVFGATVVGQTNEMNITIVNIGCAAMTGEVDSIGPFEIVSGTPFNLAPGATSIVTVSFRPLAAVGYSNEIPILSDGGIGAVVASGLGQDAALMAVSPLSHDFGYVATGQSAQTIFVIANLGDLALSGTTTAAGAFAIIGNGAFNLGAHESSNIVVSFTPPAAGAFSNEVIFAGSGGTLTSPVAGFGSVAPQADFVAIARTGQIPFAVTFTDLSTGTITNRIWDFGDGATSNATGSVVTHVYTMTGTSTVQLIAQGPFAASTNMKPGYIIETNCPPQLLVASTQLNFGEVVVGQSNTMNLVVVNIGCESFTGFASVVGPFNIVEGSPFVLAPGQTNHVAVRFQPVSAGGFTNLLSISSDGGNVDCAAIGIGLTPALLGVSPGSHDFGTIATGQIVQTVFVVTNLGQSALIGTAQVSGAFAIMGSGVFNIGSHGASNITVSFAPQSGADYSNDVVLVSNGGDSTNPVTGTGAAPIAADFVADVRTGQAPLVVSFTDLSTGPITNRYWSFGDGDTTNTMGLAVAHNYINSGNYTVQLIAQGTSGADTNTRPAFIVVQGDQSTGYDLYIQQITNSVQRGYLDDPDGDGYCNLLEYVTGGDPAQSDALAAIGVTKTNGTLSLRFWRNTNSVDATLLIEGSFSTVNDAFWQSLATNQNGSWGSATNVIETGEGTPVRASYQDTAPFATNRFLRLRVTRP